MNLLLLATLFLSAPACQTPAAPTSVPAHSHQQSETLEGVFDRVHTSVVTIMTVGQSGLVDQGGKAVLESGIGSGVVVSKDGKIVTAAHVVQTAEEVAVEFANGERMLAKIVGSVPAADLALIQIVDKLPAGIAVAPMGDSDKTRVGGSVFVIGSPLGISHTLTVGHISARRAVDLLIPGADQVVMLQTDAAISKGNSGGPMFNMKGEVVGIVSSIVSRSGGSEGLGFTIASNVAKSLLLDRDPIWSGIDSVMLDGSLARAFQLPVGRSGALVQRVAKGSIGERLGILGGSISATIEGQEVMLGGDIIIEAGGLRVNRKDFFRRFLDKLEKLKPEDEFTVLVLRGGKEKTLGSTFGELTAK